MSRRLTETDKRMAVKLYEQGETMTAIGQMFGVTRTAIGNMLRFRGVTMRRVGKLSLAQRAEAVLRYESGASQQDLAASYGVTTPAIRSLLTRRSVRLRRPVRTLNEDVFDELTEEACYWIGFLFADGSVNSRPGATLKISVGLAIVDRAHLEKFREFLGSSNTVGVNRDGEACQFSITSNKLAGRLLELGRYEGVIDAGLTSSRHFWRGVVDGDGSIGAYPYGRSNRLRPQLRVVGRMALLKEFVTFLSRNRMPQLYVHPHKTIYSVGTTGGSAAEIACLLYADAKVALDRKAAAAAALANEYLVQGFRRRQERIDAETVTQLPLFDEPEADVA